MSRKPAHAPARAALTPPPATGPLDRRILATIARATSKVPANADDVAALVGGPAADFWKAFEQLKREHRVNVAIIRRATDPAEWLAIWPTGLPVKHETWLDQNRHGAFVALPAGAIRQHLPTRPHLDADPRPDLRAVTAGRTTTLATERRNRIAALVAGRPLVRGLTFKEVADAIGVSASAVHYLYDSMIEGDRVASGRIPGESKVYRLYDPKAEAAEAQRLAAGLQGRIAAHQAQRNPSHQEAA